MKLSDLIKNLEFQEKINLEPTLEISGICSDSRRVQKRNLFVACPGPHADGHVFIREAVERQASVIVSEKGSEVSIPGHLPWLRTRDARQTLSDLLNQFYGFPSRDLDLVGITGTNGKTTIAYLLSYLLNTKISAGYIGTLGAQNSKWARPLNNTTPGSEELFSLLAQMRQENIRAVALEVSSHALDQKRVNGLQFKLAVFTQLTPEHLDYHQTLENYFQTKRLLFNGDPRPELMLINWDSPYGRRLLGEHPYAKSFSLEKRSDYWAQEIETTLEGSEFIFEGPRGKVTLKMRLPMRHNVENAVAVLASLDLLGFNPADFCQALEEFDGIPGRLERIEGNGFSVFVDYAHTPDAFENILSETKRFRPKRILTLFGCGGDRDPYKRPEMTRIAYHYSDLVILTSDNPRTEDPKEIIRQMRQGLPAGMAPNVLEVLDRREALDQLLSLAQPGDVVLVLGKGHEDYQIFGKEKRHFDDREIIQSFLARRARVSL